ncbi:MAG: sulfurtransferase [Gemmatimonadota bacterium]|nr:MAG: sulfurtransferase [Gemmatimonadota bacterium]
MRSWLAGFVALATLCCAAPEQSVEVRPLVSADCLAENLDAVIVLDIRSERPDAAEGYRTGHIPGAIHSDYSATPWRVERQRVPGMLAAVELLEQLIGGLGISNDDHVVIVAAGASSAETASATRVYWQFKVLGHEAVSILDGGFSAWKAAGLPLELEANRPEAVTYTAGYRGDLLAGREDVLRAIEAGTPLIDARAPDFYQGRAKSSVTARYGTILGARNVPHMYLTRDGGGTLVDKETAMALWKQAGLPTEGEQVAFCNTGHLASVAWFVSYEVLGNKQARLYDGSLAEWSADEELPMDNTGILVND